MNDSINSAIIKAASQPFFTPSSAQWPSLAAYRGWLESQGGAPGVMKTNALIETDLNGDGQSELIIQFTSYPAGSLGASSNLPTPNRLVIFASDAKGNLTDVTSNYIASAVNGAVALDGQIAGFAVGDLNGDQRPDLAFAVNRDDGRAQSSNLSAQSAALVSQQNGSFKLVSIDVSAKVPSSVAESVAILSSAGTSLPQMVFSTKELQVDAGASLVRYVIQPNDPNATPLWLSSMIVENTVTLVQKGSINAQSTASTSLLGLDQDRGVVQFRVNSDGSLTETGANFPIEVSVRVFKTATGTIGEFTTEPRTAKTCVLGDALYLLRGIDAASYVLAARGTDPIIAVALRLQRVTAVEDENGDWTVTALGAERSLLQFVSPGVYEPGTPEIGVFKGDTESSLQVVGIEALDVDGDGHQDLAISYQGGTPSLSLYMNAGNGNFYPVGASAIPDITDLVRGVRGDVFPTLVHLGPDQAVDLLFVNTSQSLNAGNFYAFQGTGAIGSGPGFSDSAVIGFNEKYYLENNEEALTALETGLYPSGLAHYLAQGNVKDVLIFAPGTHLSGTAGNDLIRAREGAELIEGFAGNDLLYPGDGNDTVFGGDGLDIVAYAGQRAQYKATKLTYQGQSAWQLNDPVSGETDLLIGVEKLQFAQAFDGDPLSEVTLDVEGNPAIAFRLYRAAFAREPDLAGLGYWVDVLIQNQNNPSIAPDQNILLLDIASAFVGSAEFKALYGDDVSSGDYVLNLYKNTLGRDPLELNPATGTAYDQAGYEYWKSVLDAGATTRQHMFVFFSESKENRDAVADLIGQGIEYIPWGG